MFKMIKMRLEQLPSIVSVIIVGVLLLCGFRVACLDDLATQSVVLAEDQIKPSAMKRATKLPHMSDKMIDISFIPRTASSFYALRLGDTLVSCDWLLPPMLVYPGYPEGYYRCVQQKTVFSFKSDISAHQITFSVMQFIKPIDIKEFITNTEDAKTEEYKGKKLYVWDNEVIMQYDDRTYVFARSKLDIMKYLDAKIGRPEWMSSKSWNSFRNDNISSSKFDKLL